MNKKVCKNHYICELCKGEFIKGLTDAETEEQFKREFPTEERRKDDAIICDDCYKKLIEHEKIEGQTIHWEN